MKFLRQLLLVEAVALVALFVVSGAIAALFGAGSLLGPSSAFGPTDSAQIGFVGAVFFGLLPTLLVGAPGYIVLLRSGLARWPYVLLLGTLPGIVALTVEPSLGLWAITCGAAIAAFTHVTCSWLGPNQSFKPTPSARLNSRC